MESLPVIALGLLAQGLFSARMLVQWISSERSGRVENPTLFWAFSLVASLLFFIYGWLREDFALMLGQVIGYYVYIWNLKAKGIWPSLHNWAKPLVAVLALVPVLAIVSLIKANPGIFATLFDNEDIPLWLVIFGSVGQVVFSFRFLYQFIYSSRRGESVLPLGFWIISLAGSCLVLSYGIIRLDPVVVLAQGFGLVTYIRNIMIWRKRKAC